MASKVWFRLTTYPNDRRGDEMEVPIHPVSPEALAEVVRVLVTHRKDDNTSWTIDVCLDTREGE